jgi:hypothetical protein
MILSKQMMRIEDVIPLYEHDAPASRERDVGAGGGIDKGNAVGKRGPVIWAD